MTKNWAYDIEVYPNVFTIAFEHVDFPMCAAYEVSQYKDESAELLEFLYWLRSKDSTLVGFNNLGFDYPILHTLIRMGKGDPGILYQKAQAIISSQNTDRFTHLVKPSDMFLPQIDLFKIHHFDNAARATSLKVLEFNMRSDDIQDLPFQIGSVLTPEQIAVLKRYNAHDVAQTKKFYHHSKEMLAFRAELTKKYNRDFTNHNDTKIGKDYFVMELERAGVSCYDYSPQKGRTPRQTPRPFIDLKDAILPWIAFEQPEFGRVMNWLKQQTITETKGVFKDLKATIGGFEFVFGLGGIHGSVESEIYESDDDWVILDLDVTSYYPNLAIQNGFYPEHLGETFVHIYKTLFEQRKQYPKKSAESAMLKLALNGVYGDSNSPFSVFYDPLFTMRITLNGQLLLCLLVEYLMEIDDLKILQVNTDGLTVRLPRAAEPRLREVCADWSRWTGLTLEDVAYKRINIRDVNNYLAVREDGSVKRKGAYEYELGWHQNAGALVVPKVAEKVLVEGAPIRQTVENWPDVHDFMLRTKVPRTSYLQWGDDEVQRVSRYLVTTDGKPLTKWMPPLKGKTEWRKIAVESGWLVQVCNRIEDATGHIDFNYYVQEVEKLVMGLK